MNVLNVLRLKKKGLVMTDSYPPGYTEPTEEELDYYGDIAMTAEKWAIKYASRQLRESGIFTRSDIEMAAFSGFIEGTKYKP